jgi:uncharacterized membrane protein
MSDQLPVDDPIFAARLSPYRSLGPTGFWILMGFVAVTCFISGVLFLVIGAWPVFFFFGLDVLLIWGAFKLSYRSGKAYEEIAVWRHHLEFRKISPTGKTTTHKLNPFWTRFQVERHEEIGIVKMVLRERGEEVDIGSFLNPLDKESFATALGQALSKAKAG